MKKIYYLIAMAVTAFTFTSCEDVPEPFGQPINPNAERLSLLSLQVLVQRQTPTT